MKLRFYHVFVLMLICIWVLLINQIGTIQVLDRVMVFGNMISRGGSGILYEGEEENFQVFTAVGYSTCQYTALANQVLAKLKREKPKSVYIYSWTANDKPEFQDWLDTRKVNAQVPMQHSTAPVIFNRLQQKRIFLGGVGDLLDYLRIQFPEVSFEEELKQKLRLDDERTKQKAKTGNVRATKPKEEEKELENNIAQRKDDEEEEPMEQEIVQQQQVTPVQEYTSFVSRSPLNGLQPQVALKKNRIVTTYRLAEGKWVTNYKPILQSLKSSYGFSYMQSAPLLSSWIVVQDQASAAHILKKYKKAIVNNIGYGGQSCFGGTKGTQLRCRADFAEKFGCNYDSLGIQPAQYRLWLEPECRQFFDVACQDEPDRLWLEKPSGGQHGAGMKVRQGCAEIKKVRGSCGGEFNNRKKYIAMPYLNPALLSRHKFDVRSFLLVASTDPHLVFYHDGFARKANKPYDTDISDRNAHITNADTQKSEDHFYSFARLQQILHEESGFPADYMENAFRNHAMKVQNYVFQVSRQFMQRRKGIYQIFALDWIIDSDGGLHMLEANSNPLVTVYPDLKDEFEENWDSMVDLVLKIQTEPESLFSEERPILTTDPEERFVYRGWHLIFNELEEKANDLPYNPCQQTFPKFSLASMTKDGKANMDFNHVDALLDDRLVLDDDQNGEGRHSDNDNMDDDPYNNGDDTVTNPGKSQRTEDSLGVKIASSIDMDSSSTGTNNNDSNLRSTNEKRDENSETPYEVSPKDIESAIEEGTSRGCVSIDFFSTFKNCVHVDRGLVDGEDDHVLRCDFTDGGYFYVIDPIPEEEEEEEVQESKEKPPVAELNIQLDPKETAGLSLDAQIEMVEQVDANAFGTTTTTASTQETNETKEKDCYPVVMVTAGCHGNEAAGIVAARHIRKTWRLRKARLIVIERLNAKGAERRGRYIPKIPKQERDLNRNFPKSGLVGDLAKEIWYVVAKVKPHVFIDLHEGWGFYGRLRSNYVKGGPLVGNPKFSKGSSVISSELAQPLGKFMANRVNDLTVTDHSKDFLSIVPPIETGLANMVSREFEKSLVLVIETTSSQQLYFRAKQQLILVATCFQLLGLVPPEFDGRSGLDNQDACVAGIQNCKLNHPDDNIIT